MYDTKQDAIEKRLDALEQEVRTIRADIDGIREIIVGEHEHFIALLGSKQRIVDVIIDRLDLIEDRLEPAFIATFPDYGRTILEISAILDAPRKR